MRMITPVDFDLSDITSDVPITETEWQAGTLNKGDQRYEGVGLYEVVADTTTDKPSVGVAKEVPTWVRVGSINRWNMFNGALHQPTIQTGGPMEVDVTPSGYVNAVAGLNINASDVKVTMTAASGVVYQKEISMVDRSIVADWHQWFFGGVKRHNEFVLLDLPTYAGATVKVEISAGTTEDVSCGVLVLGERATLGQTLLNYSIRNRYFSRRERSVFGDFLDILSRPIAREATFEVWMDSDEVSRNMNLVDARRDLPSVYVGDENYRQSIVFGFPDEPEVEQVTPRHSLLNLTILGQT